MLLAISRSAVPWKNLSTANWPRFMPTPTDVASSSSPTPRTPTWPSALARPAESPEAHAGEVRFRTLDEYREQIRQIIAPGAGRHHADVGQHERRAHARGAAVRHSRTSRRPCGPTTPPTFTSPAARSLRRSTLAKPFRIGDDRHIQCGHRRLRPGRAEPRGESGAVLGHVQQRPRRWICSTLEALHDVSR